MKFYSSSSPIILFSFFVFFIFKRGEALIELPKNVTIPALFVFGDSIVDQGNNNNLLTTIKCNHSPYGRDFLDGKPTGRFCNGKTPPDLMAEELGIKVYIPAYLDPDLQPSDLPTGVSFASGGTGYDPQTSQIQSVLSLSDELNMFKDYIVRLKEIVGEERANYTLSNSLFFVVAGSDDLANTYFTSGTRRLQYNVTSYIDFMVQKATEFLKELYELGPRRIGVFSIPPIGCLPSQRTLAGGILRECNETYNQAAQLFNSKLNDALNSLKNSLNDANARIAYSDCYNPFLDLIQNHDNYGFTVVNKGCCGSGTIEVTLLCNKVEKSCSNDSSYIFWDSYHPTERAYKIIIDRILQENMNSFY